MFNTSKWRALDIIKEEQKRSCLLFSALMCTKHALKCLQDLFLFLLLAVGFMNIVQLNTYNNDKSGIMEKIVLRMKAYCNF